MISKQHKIKKGFNLLAPFYDALKFPFTFLQPENQILKLAPQLKKGKTHIIIGVGSGKYASILDQHTAPRQLICVDLSDKMLELTRSKIGDKDHTFLQLDILDALEQITPSDYLHLPFILDCLSRPKIDMVIHRLQSSQHSNIILQDFNYSTRLGGKIRDRILHQFFAPILTLDRNYVPDFRQIFIEKGFYEASNLLGSKTFTSVFKSGHHPQEKELKNQQEFK